MDEIKDLVNAVINLSNIMGEMNEGHHYTAMQTITVLEKMNERISAIEKAIAPDVDVQVYAGDDGLLWVDVYVNGEQTAHYTEDVD